MQANEITVCVCVCVFGYYFYLSLKGDPKGPKMTISGCLKLVQIGGFPSCFLLKPAKEGFPETTAHLKCC